MNLRRIKRVLWLTAVMVGGTGVFVIFRGLTMPLDRSVYPTPGIETVTKESSDADRDLPSLAELTKVAARDYRQMLFDPPPPPPPEVPQPKPKPMPAGKLVGTVVNGANSSAMIEVKGEVTFMKVDDRIGEDSNFAVIKAIETNRIVLEHDGKEVNWTVEEQQ